MKRSIKLVSLALCLCLLFTGCMSKEEKARVESAFDVLESMDAAKIYETMDENTKASITQEVVAERMNMVYDNLAVESVEYKKAKVDKEASKEGETVYNSEVTLKTASGDVDTEATITLRDDGAILWTPAAVMKDLNFNNTMVVETTAGKRGTIYARNGEVLAQDGENGARQYPMGALTASCVGYVRAATASDIEAGRTKAVPIGTEVGRSGFEAAYQDRLVATSGITAYLSDHPETILMQTEPQDGEDITTTIDLGVQSVCATQLDGEEAAAVMVEPSTGQVLAMVDRGYDPTNWLDENMSEEDYNNAVENGVAPSNGLFATKYTPGSTQKLSTTYIGLKNGTLTQDSFYEIYGEDWSPGNWGSYKVHRVVPYNGPVTLKDALVYSDNIFFARTALDMGYDAFNSGMKSLGYGVDVPGAYKVDTSQITSYGEIKDGHETGLADSAYGQYQVMISPLQQTLIYASLQNGGKIMKPCYTLDEEPEVWIDNVATESDIKFINDALRVAVTDQHPTADVDGAKMSCKTGTAEVGSDGSTNRGWICGSDLNNPNWTMCVMVNYVENRGGSDVNATYMGNIISELYKSCNGPYVPSGFEAETDDADKKEK